MEITMPAFQFKTSKILRGIIDPRYPEILVDMVLEVGAHIQFFDCKPVITSAYREGDTGVHGYYRGIDIRSRGLNESQKEYILRVMNDKYKYDPKRPKMECVILHDVGRGEHFHIQCHPNTVQKTL